MRVLDPTLSSIQSSIQIAVVDVDETLIETDELIKILEHPMRESLENINSVLLSSFLNHDLLDILESGKFTDIIVLSNNSSDWYVKAVAEKIRLPFNCKLWIASANHSSRRVFKYIHPNGRIEYNLIKDLYTVESILGRSISIESILFFDDSYHVLSEQLKQNNLNRQFVKVKVRSPLFQKLYFHFNVKNSINWIEELFAIDAYKEILGYSSIQAKVAVKRLLRQNVLSHSHSDRKESYIPVTRVLRELTFLCDQLRIPIWRIASFFKNGLSLKVALAFEGNNERQCNLYMSPIL
jgi:hypothetical protein